MVFKSLNSVFDGFLELNDGSLKEGLSLGESSVFFLEMGGLSNPVGGLFLFVGEEVSSGSNELLSDLGEEFQDLDDGLVVDLGGELSQSGN